MCYGAPGTALLFENEYTRVWEVVLEPGALLAMHRHEYPYVVVVLDGAPCLLTREDGSAQVIEPKAGDIEWKPAHDTHGLQNIGDRRFRNRFVEFKR